ncbi:uncharacterized protein LOC144152475 isoform X2 [Haemaphysalis longicornis]
MVNKMRAITLPISFAFLASLASGGLYGPPYMSDLMESLNTTEPVWKKVQNYIPSYNCTRATKIDLNKTMEWNHLYAKLAYRVWQPIMEVSKTPGGRGINYTLHYWNRTEKCGILLFQPSQSKMLSTPATTHYRVSRYCELHVWNSTINKNISSCDREYNRTCGGLLHSVYSDNCQRLTV